MTVTASTERSRPVTAAPVVQLDYPPRLVGGLKRMRRQFDTANLGTEHHDGAGMALLTGNRELEPVDAGKAALPACVR